nr:hypothetical protein [Tanacetum cinerariifolium]
MVHEMPSGKIGVYTSKRPGSDVVCYTKPLDSLKTGMIISFGLTLLLVPPLFLGIPARASRSTVGRVVPLLPIAPVRASSELEASIDKLLDEGASGDVQGTDIQPVAATTNTIVEDVAPLQLRRQRKRKTVVIDASGPSYPPKKLRGNYGALGGASTAGKSMSVVQSLFTTAVLNAEARGEPISTLPFVTSSVSTIPEHEDKSPADSVTGLNLRTNGAPQRFVISSDSSHYSGANIAEAEVDSIVRSFTPAIATVTTVTAAIDVDATADRAPVAPSLFGVGSSLTGRTDFVPGGFFDVSGSDFLIGGIRTVVDHDSDLQKDYVPRWSANNRFGLDDSRVCREMLDEFTPLKFFASVHGMDYDQLFIEFNVRAARQISLNAEVRMCAEYNIREKRKLRAVVDEQAKLLKVRDGEIESLKAQLLLKEAKAAEAILKVREQEVADLDAQVTTVKLQNNNLVDQVADVPCLRKGVSIAVVSLYAPFPNAFVTSYGPSHLGPSLPPSFANGLGMFNGGEALANAYFFTPVFKRVISKLLSVVRYYFSWKTESAYDIIPYELFNLSSCYGCHWLCFYPFGKVIYCHYEKFYLAGTFRKRSGYVNSPFVKWPWGCDRGQLFLQNSWHGTMDLTVFTFSYQVFGVCVHSWPEIT